MRRYEQYPPRPTMSPQLKMIVFIFYFALTFGAIRGWMYLISTNNVYLETGGAFLSMLVITGMYFVYMRHLHQHNERMRATRTQRRQQNNTEHEEVDLEAVQLRLHLRRLLHENFRGGQITANRGMTLDSINHSLKHFVFHLNEKEESESSVRQCKDDHHEHQHQHQHEHDNQVQCQQGTPEVQIDSQNNINSNCLDSVESVVPKSDSAHYVYDHDPHNHYRHQRLRTSSSMSSDIETGNCTLGTSGGGGDGNGSGDASAILTVETQQDQQQLGQIQIQIQLEQREQVNQQLDHDHKCAVCLAQYIEGDALIELPCRHIFHRVCITEWLLSRSVCPLCKQRVIISGTELINRRLREEAAAQAATAAAVADAVGDASAFIASSAAGSISNINPPSIPAQLIGLSANATITDTTTITTSTTAAEIPLDIEAGILPVC